MKNREWLKNMSIYDLLMMIEKNINDIYTNTPVDGKITGVLISS